MTAALQRMPSDLTALDATGRVVPLAELWRDRPAVLAFVRHFG